jgi:hypothetical protein
MYRSLAGLPNRTLLDTMMLLNGAFIQDGIAHRAIHAITEMGFSACCDDTSWSDANRILISRRGALGLTYDPIPIFEDYAKNRHIVHLPPSPANQEAIVNPADQHLANAAMDRNAWVLTEDAPLIKQLIAAGIEVRNTWDILYASLGGIDPPLEFPLRVTRLSQTTGHLFGRIVTGQWAARRQEGQYTICEVENIGRLYYDNGPGRWIIEMRNGSVVSVDCNVETDEIWAVCASYRLPMTTGHRGNVTLRAAGSAGQRKHGSETTLKALPPSQSAGRISFGHSVSGNDHLNGCIRAIVLGRKPVSRILWRAISSISEGAPNPFGADVLDDALTTTQFTEDGIAILPRQSDLS